MMKLYWSPRTRSFTALWMMEETGKPYERVLTDIDTGAQKTPEYLAINPMGKVPALKDGDATLAEQAAICAYVAERYPDAGLAPPLGDPATREISSTGCSSRRAASNPQSRRSSPSSRSLPAPRAGATPRRCSTCWTRRWSAARGSSATTFSAADVMIGSEVHAMVKLFKMVPSRPSFDRYIDACEQRPAFQRALKLANG